MLDRLRNESGEWEILVIGGGATGLSVAVDAASRGYRTALIEQGDFATATSSRSTKLIHGGLRYLQQGRLGLVRESLHERGRLLRNAPHLVRPLQFIVPNYKWHDRFYYGAGLKVYDTLAGSLRMGWSKHLSRREALEQIPTLAPAGLRGGIAYFDGQFDDARLAVAFAQTVTGLNGVAVNYVKASSLIKEGGRVAGVTARNLEGGGEFELRARVVINATGIFTDEVRHLDNAAAPDLLTLSQGAHIVLEKKFLPGKSALIVPRTADGRVLFAIPWHDRTLIGTTDTPASTVVAEPRPLSAEIEFLVEHAARYLACKAGPGDILSAFAGLRPLVKSGSGRNTAKLSRSHRIEISKSGLVTITGGKWTTCRQMAEDTVNEAAKTGGLPSRPCCTAELPLHGRTEAVDRDAPFAAYGADAAELRSMCDTTAGGHEPLHPRLPYCAGQIHWAVRHEMAQRLDDVLSRRLRALLLDARAAMEMAPQVARIMAAELDRDAAWESAEVAAFRELAAGYLVG